MYRIFGKRLVDVTLSAIGLIVFIPVFCVVPVLIKLDSCGPVFFRQKRTGKNGRIFTILKFRSMEPDCHRESQGFEPGASLKVTRVGRILRKTKTDEIPQLVNVFAGDMSFIGPRPEVEAYRGAYSGKFAEVLSVRPGITDRASIKYRNEEYLLANSIEPHRFYQETILPDKLEMALKYVREEMTFRADLKIIILTLLSIVGKTMTTKEKLKELVLRYRRLLIILAHFFIFLGAYVLSYLLRFDFKIPDNEMQGFYLVLPQIIGIQMMVSGFFGLFHGLWQYVEMDDLIQITKSNVVAIVIFGLSLLLLGERSFPRTVFLMDFIFTLWMTCSLRFSFKLLKEMLRNKGSRLKKSKILIVGAGYAGVRLLKEIQRNHPAGEVVGFIDDDPKKLHETIQNLKILGCRGDISRMAKKFGVDEIILAVPSASGKEVRDILSCCEQTKLKIRVVPSLGKVFTGEMEVKPREVLPEDLLVRETVAINTNEVLQYIQDRIVLVTGAGGSIGSEICRQVAALGPREIILFDHYENFIYSLALELRGRYPHMSVRTVIGDIRDVGLLKNVFKKRVPQIVFHAAAHKHVPLMEESPTAAVKNNIFGTRNIIYACHHYGVERMVQISTDKAVNPINVMGMSKRVAEIILQSRSKKSRTKMMAVRFGNVLGSAGSVVPFFKKQITNGGPITVTHPEVKRYFMSIKEAVMLVLQAGALGKGGEIFILDMGEQVKVVDIVKNLVGLSGLSLGKDIKIEFTGLRPGEKLEEEILLDKEKDAVTRHNKIFMSRNQIQFNHRELNLTLKKLHRMSEVMDEERVVGLLREIIELGGNGHSSGNNADMEDALMPPVRKTVNRVKSSLEISQ